MRLADKYREPIPRYTNLELAEAYETVMTKAGIGKRSMNKMTRAIANLEVDLQMNYMDHDNSLRLGSEIDEKLPGQTQNTLETIMRVGVENAVDLVKEYDRLARIKDKNYAILKDVECGRQMEPMVGSDYPACGTKQEWMYSVRE